MQALSVIMLLIHAHPTMFYIPLVLLDFKSSMAEDKSYTVKTFGLLQPYFGNFSCIPVV